MPATRIPPPTLLTDDLPADGDGDSADGDSGAAEADDGDDPDRGGDAGSDGGEESGSAVSATGEAPAAGDGAEEALAVYGDVAYGAGELLARLEAAGCDIKTKVQPPPARGELFGKDRFVVDLDTGTVTCPNQVRVPIRPAQGGGGTARFGTACTDCPLAAQCTSAAGGCTISVTAYEAELVRARARQTDPDWQADYRATRPKVERKIGHLMRRRHGGRRARVRGQRRVAADFSLLAAAGNLARLGALGLRHIPGHGWATSPC